MALRWFLSKARSVAAHASGWMRWAKVRSDRLDAPCGSPTLHPPKNAGSGGIAADAARGWALASRSSRHRVFRSRGRVSTGQASFAIKT